MSESEQDRRTPRVSIVGDTAKLAGLANVCEMTKAVGLAGLHDSTRLAGLARLSLDETKVAALENLREAMRVRGLASIADSSQQLAGLSGLRDATKVAGIAEVQKKFEKAGLVGAGIKEQMRRLDRLADQSVRVERFERDRRMFEAMKARNRIDDELREFSLRQARRAAELEAAQDPLNHAVLAWLSGS